MKSTTAQNPPGPLQVERLSDGRRKLLRRLDVVVNGEPISVRTDFVTDFSSIPWFARFVIDWSKVDVAGVVHDFLYSVESRDYSRSRADVIWFKVAISGSHRANVIQAALGYVAIVLFGWWLKETGPGCTLRHKVAWAVCELLVFIMAVVLLGPPIWKCLRQLVCNSC